MNLKTDMLFTELVVKEGDEVNMYIIKEPLNAPNLCTAVGGDQNKIPGAKHHLFVCAWASRIIENYRSLLKLLSNPFTSCRSSEFAVCFHCSR